MRAADGEVIDATRLCRINVDSSLLSVSPNGRVRPRQDGTTDLIVSLQGESLTVPVEIREANAPIRPDFQRDVAPVISRLGCNVGKCHGARDGKNGFKLSLRGYDALADVRAFTDDLAGRRADRAAPAQSLMLSKPTAQVPHQGGQLLEPGSDYYRVLHAWIGLGASFNPQTPKVSKLDVYPKDPVVQRIGSRQQLRVALAGRWNCPPANQSKNCSGDAVGRSQGSTDRRGARLSVVGMSFVKKRMPRLTDSPHGHFSTYG